MQNHMQDGQLNRCLLAAEILHCRQSFPELLVHIFVMHKATLMHPHYPPVDKTSTTDIQADAQHGGDKEAVKGSINGSHCDNIRKWYKD